MRGLILIFLFFFFCFVETRDVALLAYRPMDKSACTADMSSSCIFLYYLRGTQWLLIQQIPTRNSLEFDNYDSLLGWLAPTPTNPPAILLDVRQGDNGYLQAIEVTVNRTTSPPGTVPSAPQPNAVTVSSPLSDDPRVRVAVPVTTSPLVPVTGAQVQLSQLPENVLIYISNVSTIDYVFKLPRVPVGPTFLIQARYRNNVGFGSWSQDVFLNEVSSAGSIPVTWDLCETTKPAPDADPIASCATSAYAPALVPLAPRRINLYISSPVLAKGVTCELATVSGESNVCCNTTARTFVQQGPDLISSSNDAPVSDCVPSVPGSSMVICLLFFPAEFSDQFVYMTQNKATSWSLYFFRGRIRQWMARCTFTAKCRSALPC
jgi:hypothetical protein